MKKIMILLLAVVMMVSACSATSVIEADVIEDNQSGTDNEVKENEVSKELAGYDFNLKLLKTMSNDDTLLYSALSIEQVALMLYLGAEGETKEEIGDMLFTDSMSDEEVRKIYKSLNASLNSLEGTVFTSANSFWIDDDLEVLKDYQSDVVDVFDAQVKNLDLQADDAVSQVNAWIEDATNGMIEKLYDDSSAFEEAMCVLLNANYFKGQWKIPFEKDYTHKKTFNGQSGTAEVDMMFSNKAVLGKQSDDYTAIKMLYGDDERFAMIVVLPDNNINDFVNELDSEKYTELFNGFEEKSGTIINLPKFEITNKIDLTAVLADLGMRKSFSDNAEFGLISKEQLMVSEVVHKARIIVDEEGTEAAAVTGGMLSTTSMETNTFEFIADKPFLFFIEDTQMDKVLYTGKIMDIE